MVIRSNSGYTVEFSAGSCLLVQIDIIVVFTTIKAINPDSNTGSPTIGAMRYPNPNANGPKNAPIINIWTAILWDFSLSTGE